MLHNKINIVFHAYKKCIILMMAVIIICHGGGSTAGAEEETLDDIIGKIEKKYNQAGFRTEFTQWSILKALEITDTASGHALFKYPGMMKWEYEKPERQSIITDGNNLWIYRPVENQVTVGRFPSLFGDGKGAGFLSDISILRKNFSITKEKVTEDSYILKLIPEDNSQELSGEASRALSMIMLHVSKKDYTVIRVITYNVYGDETKIDLTNIDFTVHPDSSVFTFIIPENTDIIQLD